MYTLTLTQEEVAELIALLGWAEAAGFRGTYIDDILEKLERMYYDP